MRSLRNEVSEDISYLLHKNSDILNRSHINEIHPEIHIKYSSVNILCGKQGKGKTLTIMKEIIKLSRVPNDIHMVIYVSKDGRIDNTYEVLKELITIPVKFVSADKIEEYLQSIYYYKLVYDKVKKEHWSDKLDKTQLDEIMDNLMINDFKRDSLQTLILFDDAAFSKILSKRDSTIVKMAHEARHYKYIFCFCVQGIKDIPLPLKEQTTTFFLYSGFMNQKLPTIYAQSGIKCIDYQEFKNIYNQLDEHDYIVVDCSDGGFEVVDGQIS